MNVAVMGLQWGDEGKGKAIDYLARDFDVVVRYQGGHNAGHTIYHEGKKVVLHLLPSGIFYDHTISVIGNGVVVNPVELVKEIQIVQEQGYGISNLELSNDAPLILPIHQGLDIVFENSRYIQIGTTRRGIGPAYEDLVGRRAVFVEDLFDRDRFYKKVKPLNDYYNRLLETFGGEKIAVESYIDEYIEKGKELKPYARDTFQTLNRYWRENKRVLFEGAQGVLLDIHFGTYPFVTSSHPTVGGIFTGTGLPPKALGKVIGICKAYTTRVGGGPFPSELLGEEAEKLREQGKEYGATTGRPRRVGWLDLMALNYSIMINGIDEVFFTKLDVLDTFDEIKVITAYEREGQTVDHFRPGVDFLEKVRPVCQVFPGWKESISGITGYEDLPGKARDYINFVETFIRVPLCYISVGTKRQQTIECKQRE